MEIPYIDTINAIFEFERPFYILLDKYLNILKYSPCLDKVINFPAERGEISLDVIFSENDYRIIHNRIISQQQLGKPFPASLNVSGPALGTYKVYIKQIGKTDINFYLIVLEEIKDPFSDKTISENIETFIETIEKIFKDTGYGVILLSQQHRILYFNSWFQRFCGCSYQELNSYDDLVKNLNIRQLDKTEDKYIKLWNITNRENISLNFTSLYIYLPNNLYVICLIPSGTDKIKENLSIYNMKYLTAYNFTMHTLIKNIKVIKSSLEEISYLKQHSEDVIILNKLKVLEQKHSSIHEDYVRIVSQQSSLFTEGYYNITQSIMSFISLFPECDSKSFDIESSEDIGFLTPFSEQIDNCFSIILDDIYNNLKEGKCIIRTNIEADKAEDNQQHYVIGFMIYGDYDKDSSILSKNDDNQPYSMYIRSLLALHNGMSYFCPKNEYENEYLIKIPLYNKPELSKSIFPGDGVLKMGVLVADDEEAIRNLTRMMMEMMGFSVFLASNGSEAIQKLRDNIDSIHLAVIDVIMPKMDGQQTFKMLRSIKPGLKVLFTSGYYTETVLKGMLKDGDAEYILKPFSYEELVQKVENLFCIS